VTLTIALDIGGTFTDMIAFDEDAGTIHQAKSATTPYDLSVGIRETLSKSDIAIGDAESFVHGTTVAINTAIERKGARTALVVTQGMRDIYKIGRGNRPQAYNIYFKRPVPYVPRHLTFEVRERLNAAGEAVVPFNVDSARQIAEKLAAADVEAVAVCLLHSFANPEHEEKMGEILREYLPDAYLSLSHQVLREYREYERTSTTVLNSYIGPIVSRYLDGLEKLLGAMDFDGLLLIMQSNGGVMSPGTAKAIPVAMMESGPVGGIIAGAEVGTSLGYRNIIAFDMGGTTAKMSLVQDGTPDIAQGYLVGDQSTGHPVMLPVVDIVEVGAGGGSIAWIDEVGALKVGPQSAGGHPGPICYGWGGKEPAITDANVVLGRVDAGRFLGGEMPLDVEGARRGIAEKVADRLGLSVNEAAMGIIKIAVAKMSLAVRGVSVERGFDPRDFALVVCGGAGPLHAVEIARDLHIPTVIVPRLPAHFSALGMLMTEVRHDYVRTYFSPLKGGDLSEMKGMFAELIANAQSVLASEGLRPEAMEFERFLDCRYVGQEFSMQIPATAEQIAASDQAAIRKTFDDLHDRRYGHKATEEPVEIVNVRLTAKGKRKKPVFPQLAASGGEALVGYRDVFLDDADGPTRCAIYDRDRLSPGQEVVGPAIIEEYASTTVLFEGDVAKTADSGEIIVTLGSP
jgi:N-methylhydantoinase A